MTTELSKIETIDYSNREVIETIKQTVAKGATDAQLAQFLQVCKATGLNPFLKEVYCIPSTNTIMASRDGYLRVANENPQFDGMETLVERENGNPVKATCKVYRKDRSHPIVCEAYFNEYRKDTPPWKQYPSAMISKVAEVLALKRSFAINGVVTEEEIGTNEPKRAEVIEVKASAPAPFTDKDGDALPGDAPYDVTKSLLRSALHEMAKLDSTRSLEEHFQFITQNDQIKVADIDRMHSPAKMAKLEETLHKCERWIEGWKLAHGGSGK